MFDISSFTKYLAGFASLLRLVEYYDILIYNTSYSYTVSQKLLSRQLIDRNSTVATFAQHLQIMQVAKNMRGRNYELSDGFLLDKIASGVQYCTTKDYVRVAAKTQLLHM